MKCDANILMVLPSWVGDVAMATPALRAMRQRYPHAHITYLQRPYLGDLLAGNEAWFDDVIHWPERSGSKRNAPLANLKLIAALRRARFDVVVLFQNSFRSAFIARLAGIPRRIGFARDGRGWLLTDRLQPKRDANGFVPTPMVDSYNELVRAADCTVASNRLELATTAAHEATVDQRLGNDDARPLLVLNPGASFGISKRWPPERYAELADELQRRHNLRVVVSCAPNEADVAERITAAAKLPITVFVDPPLGLGPLKALVRRARLLITNDTGPRHFAAAYGVPVVTIYGSTDPAWTVTDHPFERSVMLALDCQPCQKPVCPLGHHNCMMELPVATVRSAAESLLIESAR